MNIQKKLWVIVVIGLLKIGSLAELQAQQLNLVSPPSDYQNSIDAVYSIYGSQIQISQMVIDDFMSLALSTLDYDPTLPHPNASLTSVSTTAFTLEWPDSPLVNEYRTSMIDLVTGEKEVLVTTDPVYATNFFASGPTLIVLQATSEMASRANIIIIDKIVMYEVYTGHNCECGKPKTLANKVSSENAYYPTTRGFSLSNTSCDRAQYKLAIKLLLSGEDLVQYRFHWEMDFEERQVQLGNEDCSDQLVINFIPTLEYPNSLISEDRNISLRLGENVLIVEALREGSSLASVEFNQCCGARKSAHRSEPEINTTSLVNQQAITFPQIRIHPNPTRAQLELELDTKQDQVVQFQLLSPQGVQIQEWTKVKLGTGKQSFTLDVGHYPPGVYFLQTSNEQESTVNKVAIVK
ncbi:MAG: T9SS type A sorting domain-containing protein [Bacteroidota bacterium]